MDFKAPGENSIQFHGSDGHSKCNCLQDRAIFQRSRGWKNVIIFNTDIAMDSSGKIITQNGKMVFIYGLCFHVASLCPMWSFTFDWWRFICLWPGIRIYLWIRIWYSGKYRISLWIVCDDYIDNDKDLLTQSTNPIHTPWNHWSQ